MKQEILDWIDQEIAQLDEGTEKEPSPMPEAFRLAMKKMVEGITWH